MPLPSTAQITVPVGAQWKYSFGFTDDDGTRLDISTYTWRFTIRPSTSDETSPALITVSSTGATGQGYITATPATSSIQVVLAPAATALLTGTAYVFALWMDPGLSDATPWLSGPCYPEPVAAP